VHVQIHSKLHIICREDSDSLRTRIITQTRRQTAMLEWLLYIARVQGAPNTISVVKITLIYA